MLDDEAGLLREDYLRLPLYAARVFAERRAQQIVELALGRAEPFAEVVQHKIGMFQLAEVSPLNHPVPHPYEEAVPLLRVPDEYELALLNHLRISLTAAAIPSAQSPMSASTSVLRPERP